MLKVINCGKGLSMLALALLFSLPPGSLPRAAHAGNSNSSDRAGLPSRRESAGTRGACTKNQTVIALMPEDSTALTLTASPTFFVHVPQTDRSQAVEFVLRDPNDALVYQTTFTTTGHAGIISVSLPDLAKSKGLKSNQDYHWYFSLICNPQYRAQDVVVEGTLRHVETEPTLAKEARSLAPLGRIEFYQRANLWHDALAGLADLKRSHPSDLAIAARWAALLASVGLDNLAQEPFLEVHPSHAPTEHQAGFPANSALKKN